MERRLFQWFVSHRKLDQYWIFGRNIVLNLYQVMGNPTCSWLNHSRKAFHVCHLFLFLLWWMPALQNLEHNKKHDSLAFSRSAPGCVLSCSSLVPSCATHSGSPRLPMARTLHLWPFLALFGHKMGQNGWNKKDMLWISIQVDPNDNLKALVLAKQKLEKRWLA